MRLFLVYGVLVLGGIAAGGCGGRVDPSGDAGGQVDSGGDALDASSPDASADVDATVPVDASVPDDADPDVDGGTDGGPSVPDAAVCMVGNVCNDTQPCSGEDRCYGFGGNGFCAPFAPECGGFAMIECTGGRICIRGGGGDLGYCATPAERDCICASAIANDITTDGCPPAPRP